ncbi:protein abnormal spindle isoform X2 [Orussus abietinus]|uniref:protein abnormal spindle isoform X2 n=1 Tax=Orussus abietinus TaxID=222816 RepID=UPI000626B1B8|nr:protein abnormal spindle isoform X2 [Orussus abietinus]
MFFQVNITPKEKKVLEKPATCSQIETEYTLLLAPFQPQIRIKLETNVNIKAQCSLIVRNTSKRRLTAKITKTPPSERNLSLNANELTIEADSFVILNISWIPRESGSWHDIIQLTDNRRIKYDVAIVTSAINYKKLKGRGKIKKDNMACLKGNGLPTTYSKRSTDQSDGGIYPPSKKICPDSIRNEQNKENICSNVIKNGPFDTPQQKDTCLLENSHNFSTILKSDTFSLTPCFSSTFTNSKPFSVQEKVPDFEFPSDSITIPLPTNMNEKKLRRVTYLTVPQICTDCTSTEVKENNEEFEDSLSPRTEENAKSDFSLINNINFTSMEPLTVHKENNRFSSHQCLLELKQELSKSRLSVAESCTSSPCGNNTFDISSTKSVSEFVNMENNGTFEICTSPRRMSDFDNVRPKRLTSSFGVLSPVMPVIDQCQVELTASSPIPFDRNYTSPILQQKDLFHLPLKKPDSSTAQEVLEANLWVKPENDLHATELKTKLHELSTISEEQQFPTNTTFTKDLSNNESIKRFKKTSTSQCLEISPPRKLIGKNSPIIRTSPKNYNKIRKDRSFQECTNLKKKIQFKSSIKDLGKRKSQIKTNKSLCEKVSIKLHDPDDFLTSLCNPDPFAATTTEDPFLASTLYYDEVWIHNQEMEFKKWLNALLSPPECLSIDVESTCIDVGKVWQSCRSKEDITLAETREVVSARYHTNTRLNTLRKAACAMFRSKEIVTVLSRVTVCIERGNLVIRQDRDLHRDIGLQKEVLELFLSYNPLWLRIGLETIYGETIPLHSNNDLVGLTRFLLARFFSDPYLAKTHSHPSVINLKLATFLPLLNKHILKKFLFVVYFLDCAKRNKLIGHDPCLFHKRAIHKESRSILLTFAREILGGIGDITKVLRPYGYIVSHKQTYLDEYDYAVVDLAVDLRDGVRLCRVMELITGQRNLTSRCRVPAISRLQKVHNVDVALTELIRAGYTLTGDIDAKSVADGHREKTLSLLWQIIYKFQKPLFNKAASCVQRWWRSRLWYVRIKHFLKTRQDNAASVIQRAWKCYLARKELNRLKEAYIAEQLKKDTNARIIQSYWIRTRQMLAIRKQFLLIKLSVLLIQSWWRNRRAVKPFVNEFHRKQNAAIILQRRYRAQQLMKKQRAAHIEQKTAALKIQSWWKAVSLGKRVLMEYQNLRNAVLFIQAKFRATQAMKVDHQKFQQIVKATRTIQIWWKRVLALKRDRNNFLIMKYAVYTIEMWWLEKNRVSEERKTFLALRSSVVIIQRSWRKHHATKKDRLYLNTCKNACQTIQTWWQMISIARKYQLQRRNCLIVQRWWRNITLTRSIRVSFLSTKRAAITVQKNWKMKKARRAYLEKKHAVLKIEKWYSNILVCKPYRNDFLNSQIAVRTIQSWWRNIQMTKMHRLSYLKHREIISNIQIRWRGKILTRTIRNNYLAQRAAAQKIQAWWRMILTKRLYRTLLAKHKAATILQSKWRVTLAMRNERNNYLELKSKAIFLQRKWRAIILGRRSREEYCKSREAAIIIQKHWKGYVKLKKYKRKKHAVNVILAWWRKLIRRRAATIIQSAWRTYVTGKAVRKYYHSLRSAAIFVQRQYRLKRLTKNEKERYITFRETVIYMQRTWRNKQEGRKLKLTFLKQKESAIKIQRWWRLILLVRQLRNRFIHHRAAAIVIQRYYRMHIEIVNAKQQLKNTILAVIKIQKWWKKVLQERKHKQWVSIRKCAVFVIEKWWISILIKRQIEKKKELKLQKRTDAATLIQSIWRGHKVRQSQGAKMTQVRKRCEKATKAALPSETLHQRLQFAIATFQKYTSLGALSMCLCSLDTITRISPGGCIGVCEHDLIDKVYGTLVLSNRSLPWMEVCITAASILLNVAKFSRTRIYVSKVEYAETIARLMTITIEQQSELFLHLATLLWILAENPDYCNAVRSCTRTTWLLRSLDNVVKKKKVKKLVESSKQKEQTLLLPSTKPDWGMKQKQPRLFSNPQHAVSTVLNKLKINVVS